MAMSRFAAGRFALELGGTMCGFLKLVEGGAITADVIVEPGTPFRKKHIGPPRFEELVLQLGLGLDKAVYQWITDSMGRLVVSTSSVNPAHPRDCAISAIRRISAVPTPRPCQSSRTRNATSARLVAGSRS